MNYVVRSHTSLPKPKAWTVNQPQVSEETRRQKTILTRRAEISWLDAQDEVQYRTTVIPALPLFLGAFCAFAQGTIIQTPEGKIAIEDLEPGMKVTTADGKQETVRWIGSLTMLPPTSDFALPSSNLFRITDGCYGLDGDAPDLLVGPAARIMPGGCDAEQGEPLKEVQHLADGGSIIQITPMSPVRVFHICLGSHQLIKANGVLAESFHPGPNARLHLSQEMFQIFMGIFPHMTNEGEFGPLNHRRHAHAA